MHDEEYSGRSSVSMDDLVELVREPRALLFPSILTPQEVPVQSSSTFSE